MRLPCESLPGDYDGAGAVAVAARQITPVGACDIGAAPGANQSSDCSQEVCLGRGVHLWEIVVDVIPDAINHDVIRPYGGRLLRHTFRVVNSVLNRQSM